MPASLALLLALVVIVWLPFRRSVIGRAAYALGSSEVAAYMSGVPIRRAKFVAYTLSGLLASVAGLFLTFITYSGEASAANGSTYTLYSIAAVVLGGVSLFGGSGSAIGAIFGALMFRTIGDLLFVFNVEPLVAAAVPGRGAARGGLPRLAAAAAHPQPARPVWLTRGLRGRSGSAFGDVVGRMRRRIDPAIAWAFGCIVLVLLVGSLYSSSFLSPEYLLQQLKVASFLGVIATGMMIVILLGQIDLSVPWVVAVGGMMATAATGWGPLGEALAIPVGVGCGVALGLVSGVGVAFLRIPSMVVTLAVNAVAQGLMVVHTGGFSPQDSSSPAMRFIATGHSVLRHSECAAGVGGGRRRRRLPADAHDVRPHGLRDRQPRARGLPLRCAHAHGRDGGVRARPAACRPSAACCSPATPARRRRRWATPTCCRRLPPWCSAARRSSAAAAATSARSPASS